MSANKIVWGEMTEEYDSFTLQGVPFRLVKRNFNKHATDDKAIVILKNQIFLNTEISYFNLANPKNMVELGLYEGGSAVFWSLLYDLKIIGFDLRKEPPPVRKWIRKIGLENQVDLHYETSQDDEKKIRQCIGDFFGNELIDIVIDDASHQYALSRRSFEFLFPLVKPGGIYCIEDWSWAHSSLPQWQVDKHWGKMPALTNLIFDVMMLLGSQGGWFQQVSMKHFAAFIFSSGRAPRTGISFDQSIVKQERVFVPI